MFTKKDRNYNEVSNSGEKVDLSPERSTNFSEKIFSKTKFRNHIKENNTMFAFKLNQINLIYNRDLCTNKSKAIQLY